MTFIDNSAKTNWKFIGIVAVIAILIGGGILALSLQKEASPAELASSPPPDLALCNTDDECVVVPYGDCCTSKTAVNKKYEEEYLSNPEWQQPSEERLKLCAVIECDDEARGVTSARCVQNTCLLDTNTGVELTATWQTYRNEEFGFEMKYPETWFILNTFLEGKVVEFRDSQWDKEPKIDGASMVIDSYKDVPREEVLSDAGFQTREEAIRSGDLPLGGIEALGNARYLTRGSTAGAATIAVETEVNNIQALVADIPVRLYGDEGYIGVSEGKRLLLFGDNEVYASINFLGPVDPEIYDQILTTFRFIEPIDTSGLQTYRNEELGFELSYPENWELGFGVYNGFNLWISRQEHINISNVPIKAGQEILDVVLANTRIYDISNSPNDWLECGSGGICPPPPSEDKISIRSFGGNSFYYVFNHLFEEQYGVVYYIENPGNNKAVRLLLRGSTQSKNWTDEDYNVDEEPGHTLLKQILTTFRFIEPTSTVKVAVIALDDRGKSGKKIGCDDSIVYITRTSSSAADQLNAAFEELFSLDSLYIKDPALKHAWYKSGDGTVYGLYNIIYKQVLGGLQFDRAVIENGVAKVYLNGAFGAMGGICDEPRLPAQIEGTAEQFPGVESVETYINGYLIDLHIGGGRE